MPQTSSLACGDHLGSVLICQNQRTLISPWRLNLKLILKWMSHQNFYFIEASDFQLGMWGSFGVSIDLPKIEDSDLTMEAILKTDPEMVVNPKLRPQYSTSLACGDHLGSVLICQNQRTQISPWRPGSKLILHFSLIFEVLIWRRNFASCHPNQNQTTNHHTVHKLFIF